MLKFKIDFDFNNFTLIVPCVSVGNVGQLAADLVISSLKMDKVGSVWHPAIVPIIGSDPYDLNSSSLMVSCELYANISKKIAVLQLRSPLVKKYAKDFLTNIADIGKQYTLHQIVILSSSFASERHTISTVPFRYLHNSLVKNQIVFNTLEWINFNADERNNEIHGGGFAKTLLEICTAAELPCLVLFKYCSEGDNIPDAEEMLNYLNDWMNLINSPDGNDKFAQPPSWKLLFGNPAPQDIY